MQLLGIKALLSTALVALSGTATALGHHANAAPVDHLTQDGLDVGTGYGSNVRNINVPLFMELEELSRLVDISYCVGVTGIRKPFECLSRCSDFPGFELVDVRCIFFLSCIWCLKRAED